ncbi:uncharacterized protein [Spinacia oleracea]|uniref:Uncharacterized protein n=1 Tax=Spinacia oleracea TaxID=3562 RepID=A0A9R0HQI3_SPIOL|nr:uncharacterized protein LOC110774728 [Spinacia oleracea]
MGSPTHTRVAEVAGGITADCATVWCCFPYTAANLLTLIIYKVPRRLCRKAFKRYRKKELIKKGLLPLYSNTPTLTTLNRQNEINLDPLNCERTIEIIHNGEKVTFVIGGSKVDDDLKELEKKMITKFRGFWRSHSQQET